MPKKIMRNLSYGIMLGMVLLFISATVTAATVDNSCLGDVSTDYSFVSPVEREDDSKLKEGEIKSYKIYIGSEIGSYPDKVNVNHIEGKKEYDLTIGLKDNAVCYAVITTTDSGGRESKYSAVVSKTNGTPPVAVIPAPVIGAVVARSGTSDRDYVISFPPVTVDDTGKALPHAMNKYYLFQHMSDGTVKWLQNLPYDKVPVTRTFRKGPIVLSFESEYIRDDGKFVVSEKSEQLAFTVDDYIEPEPPIIQPEPPVPAAPKPAYFIDIPEDATKVKVTFE